MELSDYWFWFVIIYSIIALVMILYRYLVITCIKQEDYPELNRKVVVIIPTYNEEPQKLLNCVKSAVEQSYKNLEVIVVDDGSKINAFDSIKIFDNQITFKRLDKNMGKRYAQSWAITHTDAEIIVTVDGDTVLDKNAVNELVKPFNNPNIGSVAGNVKISNTGDNLLTAMIGARYFNAFLFERRCQGLTNSVVCNGGPLSAYRKEIILNNLSDYNNQTFLGNKCHYGDDRRMTAYVHQSNYRTYFVPSAIAYTEIPNKLPKLLKMLTRWKKSFYRETYLSLGYMWKNKLLSMENLYGLIIPFVSLFIRVNILIMCILSPVYILWYIFIIGFMALVRSVVMFTEDRKLIIYNILYAYLHEILIYWLNFYALFTMKDNKWGTR